MISRCENIWTRSLGLFTERTDARSRGASKSRGSGFDLSNRFEIWQALRQQRCRGACQISKRCDHYNIHSRDFETLLDLAVRCLTSSWGPGSKWPAICRHFLMGFLEWDVFWFTFHWLLSPNVHLAVRFGSEMVRHRTSDKLLPEPYRTDDDIGVTRPL